MKISLMLDSVSQDQLNATNDDDVAFHGWMHTPSSGGDGDRIANAGDATSTSRLPKYSLRQEDWGGVLVYGPTQSVYQLDTDALSLVKRLKAGEEIDDIVKNPAPFTEKQVADFSASLKDLKLV